MFVIDTHIHPALYGPICKDADLFKRRCDEMNYHLMKPTSMDLLMRQYALAEMKHAVLLAQDCSISYGFVAISNEDVQKLVEQKPDFFIGFASVDPRSEDACNQLEDAFTKQDLSGFTVNTSKLRMYPADERLCRLYDICKKHQKPIIFHAGVSLENNTISKYAHPMEFEEVAVNYPTVKICLAHFGWPWVNETAALLIKYENVYTNTAMMYMDSPQMMMEKVFRQDLGRYWLDHDFCDKVMFGSDSPRIRPVRIKKGLDALEMKEETREKVYFKNAVQFLNLGGIR